MADNINVTPKRVVCVPKGVLKINVLKMLNKKPMSGSELVEEIKNRTSWTPSSGSIYPLLKRLGKHECIERVNREVKLDVKRFTITDKGRDLLKHQERKVKILSKKFESTIKLWFTMKDFNPKLFKKSIDLFNILFELDSWIKENSSLDSVNEAIEALTMATEKMRNMMI